MKIRSFAHKGRKRLYTEGNAKGVPADTVEKLRKVFAFLEAMHEADESRVTGHPRLTFVIDDEREIRDLNLEDYH